MLLPFFYFFMFVADVKPHVDMLQQLRMADGITKWQMEWPLQGMWLVDVITDRQMVLPWANYLFYFEFWDAKQNLIPNVWQMVFANISI